MTLDSKLDDTNTNINFFKDKVKAFVNDRRWKKYHNPDNLAKAINIEAAELLELFLFKNIEREDILGNQELKIKISEEIADVFIYLVSLINTLDLDLTKIFLNKMDKNKVKYPLREFHNGNYKKK